MLELASAAADWDLEHADRPHERILKGMTRLGKLRFQPYQNEENPFFIERLRYWLDQFSAEDQRAAFLLASQILFITRQQFEGLQRHLFEREIRWILHREACLRSGQSELDFANAATGIQEEMDRTLFISNSDSSRINGFVHINHKYFQNHGNRNLTGEPASFWTYPARRSFMSRGKNQAVVDACRTFETEVLCKDSHLVGKNRLVILEDFSGTGSDLKDTLDHLDESELDVDHIVLAPVIATEYALDKLRKECKKLTKRRYEVACSLCIPYRWQCFLGPKSSYLDQGLPMKNLSRSIKYICDRQFRANFQSATKIQHRYGLGGLALAVVLYSNCPDNSLPILWSDVPGWRPLFRRVSRFL